MAEDVKELVLRAQRGDTGAFSELVRRYRASVHAYVLSRVSAFAWAEDLSQETFVAAFLGIDRLRDVMRFGSWLRSIADNLCRMWWRRTGRQERLFRRSADRLSTDVQMAETQNDFEAGVLAALARLSPKSAAAVTLYYCDGLTQRECAGFLGVSQKAIESRLHRARHELRQEMIRMAEKTLKTHSPGDSFDDAVMAEITKLVKVVGGPYRKATVEPAEERLRLLFSRNEERLSDLIRRATCDDERRAAERMVHSLGSSGVNRVLTLALSDDEALRSNALGAIPTHGDGAFVYLVLECIQGSGFTETQKVRLLADLARRPTLLAGRWPRFVVKRFAMDSPLYVEMLMQFGQTAIAYLSEQLQSLAEHGVMGDPWLFGALVRFGTESMRDVLPWLTDPSNELALAAVEMIRALCEARAKAVNQLGSSGWPVLAEGDLFLATRDSASPIVHPERVDSDVMERAGACLTRMLERDSDALRQRTIDALGYFDDNLALVPLTAALNSADVKDQAAAARSLGRKCSASRVEPLVAALAEAPLTVKTAAHDSLVGFWTQSHHVAHLRADPSSSTSDAVARFLASRDELEALVAAIDQIRDRVLGALGRANALPSLTKAQRRALSPRGNVWRISLDEKINFIIEASRQRREKEEERRARSELSQRAQAYHRDHPDAAKSRRGPFVANIVAAVRTLPEDREYPASELTERILAKNTDPSATRRRLIDEGWMVRKGDRYRFTPRGARAWKMEHLLVGRPRADH